MLPVTCQTMYGIPSTIPALCCEVHGDTRGSGPQQEAEQNRLLQPIPGGGPRGHRRGALGRLQAEDAPGSPFLPGFLLSHVGSSKRTISLPLMPSRLRVGKLVHNKPVGPQ